MLIENDDGSGGQAWMVLFWQMLGLSLEEVLEESSCFSFCFLRLSALLGWWRT